MPNPDPALRRRLLDFELALDAATCDETLATEWGRAYLTPSLPLVWDGSWIAVEQTGLSIEEVTKLADQVLGEIGVSHRAVALCDEADGRRLAAEARQLGGWEVELAEYMVWSGESGRRPLAEVREARLEKIAPLRLRLIPEWLPPSDADPAETAAQLLELERRYARVAGDRWFVSPPEEPVSACTLLGGGDPGLGQVEDVGTLERARGRGLAQAVVLKAVEESRAAGHEVTFLVADGDDWPRLIYEKLGFAKVGELHILRRKPT